MSTNSTNPNPDRPRPRFAFLRRAFKVVAYWFNLIVQPALAIAFIVWLAWGFGYMQRNHNWFNDSSSSTAEAETEEDSIYACSMLCVFVKAPGRCPVCGMELQKIESQGDPKDIFGVTIDPSSRRLANIETVTALNMPMSKETEALGRITYDETTESTIASYMDGRIVELFVDYTGATVRKGDALAVLYSPDLYADQVGLLSAKQAMESNQSSNERVNRATKRLYESARRRLVELGIPESQINQIESQGKPDRRVKIFAPQAGTVVQKLADLGNYVTTGMPILKIADLSNVWLMLEMYPEDTSNLKLGQTVNVSIQSQVGKAFEGRISFIDPMVDQKTQTVKVRVVIPNEAGLIKIGDFGKARIQSGQGSADNFVIVPRESVLINGDNSVAYVETEPGRFEFRKVAIAEIMGDKISLASGIKPGEQVVASGAFMLDSTFNIQGKVSLIDPNRAVEKNESQSAENEVEAKEIEKAFANLSPEDLELAKAQVICPVTEVKLGTLGMGAPIRVTLAQRDVMICCEGCRSGLTENPAKYYAILDAYHNDSPSSEELAEIEKSFAPLSPEDRKLAEKQVICPVTEVRLGTMGMGTPINVDVNGTPVMICCEGCRKGLFENPEENFEILRNYKAGKPNSAAATNSNSSLEETGPSDESSLPQMDLPQMDLPQMDLPQMDLPQMELPQMEAPK